MNRLGNLAVTGQEGVSADVAAIRRAHTVGGTADTLRMVPVEALGRSPWQPRTAVRQDDDFAALVESVAAHGVLEPVLARELPGGALELLAGERRLEASKAAGRATVPVRVLVGVTELAARAIALTENLARTDLSPWEEAQALRMLRDARADAGEPVDVRTLGAAAGRDRTTTGQLLMVGELLTPEVIAQARQAVGAALVSDIDNLSRATLYGIATAPTDPQRVEGLALALRGGAPARGRPPERPAPAPEADAAGRTDPAPRPRFAALGSPDDPRGVRLLRPVDALTPTDAADALAALEPLVKALRRRAKATL